MSNFIDKSITFEDMSPQDKEYPVEFLYHNLNQKLNDAKNFANDIYNAIISNAGEAVQIKNALKKDFRFVVNLTDEQKQGIKNGTIKLCKEKGDHLRAQIMEENGHFGERLDIKEEIFRQGIDPIQMATTLQLKALQSQIEDIGKQINNISANVRQIEEGQQNDRISLFYSGLSLYLEAKNIENEDLKLQIISQSLKTLSESSFKLMLEMRSSIAFLKNGEYNQFKGKRTETITEYIKKIDQCFEFIHNTDMLRAGIYCEQGEYSAMISVLDEYSKFIKEDVAGNSFILSQFDKRDNGALDGLWSSRANLSLDVGEIKKQLSCNNEIYIELIGDEEK